MRTLEITRDNALNLIRILLAVLVIVSHSFPIGGFGPDPAVGDLSLGHFAVGGFFAISGYLITRSRFQSGLGTYMWSRVLRIFPGYWVCLVFTAFAAAGLAGAFRGSWTLLDGLKFLVSNALMIKAGGGDIGTTLAGAPYPEAWNGSLWTLRYEFACYVVIGLVLLGRKARTTVALFPIALVAATAVSVVIDLRGTGGIVGELGLLVPFFVAGAALYAYAEKIPSLASLAALAAVAIVAASALDFGRSLTALPTAYLMMYLGNSMPKMVRHIGSKTDISYGTYLYAFPVQQLLVLAGAHALGPLVYVTLSIVCTLPLAFASFLSVEKPALKLKTKRSAGAAPARQRSAAGATR
ncbi:acyltransferase family protein [Arthrobacter sp. NPDC058288]|uniref:acyltransferase family protein n=1 Tax=Arthrobacter sp. NPDC058288 TaxID=3346424 RepID=UPI0036E96D48